MLRAFKLTMYVAIDSDEIILSPEQEDDVEDEGEQPPEPTIEEIKEYLKIALLLDVDTEGEGNPVGFCSAEIIYDTMTEMSREEVKSLYNT